MRTDELATVWRAKAEQLAPFAPAAAEAFRTAAGDLEAAIAEDDRELLTMREAVAYSGYCGDHLTALVRRGILPNHGRKHAPRFKRGELPLKPIAVGQPSRLSLVRPGRDLLGTTPRQAAAAIADRRG